MSEGANKNNLLKRAAAFGIAGAALFGVKGSVTSSQELKNNLAGHQFAQEATTQPDFPPNQIGSLILSYDNFGIPSSYQLAGQEVHEFTTAELKNIKDTINEARQEGVPKLLISIPGEYLGISSVQNTQFGPDRPLISESDLPDDILTEDQLNGYGVVEVIQSDNVTLSIRKVAFQPGGILYDLFRAQSLENPIKLRIVLVDSPLVSGDYMHYPKYNDVWFMPDSLTQSPEDYRQQQIQSLQTELDNAIENFKKTKSDDAKSDVITIEGKIDDYETATIPQLEEEMLVKEDKDVGEYFAPDGINDSGDQIATIFIAVGQSQPPQVHYQFFVDETGKILEGESMIFQNQHDYTPAEANGFPRPSDFTFNSGATQQNNEYPYGAQNHEPGEDLDHELEHLEKITLKPALDGTVPDPSEYNTDNAAMGEVGNEFQKWQKGINDYPFIFHENGSGTYQWTGYVKPEKSDQKV